jgi:hypothetical protein
MVDFSPLSSLNPVSAMMTFVFGPDLLLLLLLLLSTADATDTFFAASKTRAPPLFDEVVMGRAVFSGAAFAILVDELDEDVAAILEDELDEDVAAILEDELDEDVAAILVELTGGIDCAALLATNWPLLSRTTGSFFLTGIFRASFREIEGAFLSSAISHNRSDLLTLSNNSSISSGSRGVS